MINTIENIFILIDEYNNTALNDGERLNEILKDLSSNLFFLEEERIKSKFEYESKVYELTKDKKFTVARAINIAEVEHPELYKLRRILDSGYRICDNIRTNISFIKSEKRNT